jgi:two-component system, NtrC family, sensor kinase
LGEYMQSYARVLSMVEQLKRPIKNKDVEQANAILTEMTALEQEIGLGFIRDDIDNLVKESQNGVERIKEIVMNLRTFSREEEGELVDINVERVIESILKIVWNEIKYKAELKKDFGGLPPVKCNANRLGQVLINVIVNAAQAIEDQGFIEIKTYQRDKYAYIEISDTGKGIDEETQKRIFDPFFTTKPAGQGIGLGLSICHDIMKKQGGELTVQSEVGKGTTFCIMLPL